MEKVLDQDGEFVCRSSPAFFPYFELCASGSVFGILIRIHKFADYGPNLDPDPQNYRTYWIDTF